MQFDVMDVKKKKSHVRSLTEMNGECLVFWKGQ